MNIKFDKEIYSNQYLADKYSKYSCESNLVQGVPFINFPFKVEEIKPEYKYLSWVLIDHDANPVVNFSWIHWLVANYQVESAVTVIPEMVYDTEKKLTRGNNSFSSPLANIQDQKIYLGYGGPTPPDKDHVYTLELYAHEEELDLTDGFFYNQLLTQLDKTDFEYASAKLLARN